MDKSYNILWIDDEHDDEALEFFIILAEEKGIELYGYSSGKEGLKALESNINFYDGIILDALFFENEESLTPNNKGLGNSIKKINELKGIKKFPYFVLSGQPNFTEDSNPIIEAFGLRCYNKKKQEDVSELLKNVIEAADSQIDTQIKHENQRLFELLNNYPDEVRNTFLSIFKGIRGMDTNFDDQLYFTQLRIILEHLFRKANAIGLLHDECVQKNGSQVNLTESSLFLSGKDTRHLNVTCSVTHFPKVIAENIKNIIHITGAASHTSQVDVTENMDIQEYRKDIKTPYLLYSLAFQIMDTLIWFDDYSKANNDIELNKSKWKFIISNDQTNSRDWVYGEIIKIENGWITFQPDTGGEKLSIPPHLVVEGMTQGQVIKVKTEPSPDGTKTFVKEAVNS